MVKPILFNTEMVKAILEEEKRLYKLNFAEQITFF